MVLIFTRPSQIELFQISGTDETDRCIRAKRIVGRSVQLNQSKTEFITKIDERWARRVREQGDQRFSPVAQIRRFDQTCPIFICDDVDQLKFDETTIEKCDGEI